MKNIFFNALRICVVLCTIAVAASQNNDPDWLAFKQQRKKIYRNQVEESQRYQIFKANSLFINKYNALKIKTMQAVPSFTLGINDFSDLV